MTNLEPLPGAAKPRLYHAPSSYYSTIARLALAEAGIDYEQIFIDILFRGSQRLAPYARLNRSMTVPTLVLPGRVLAQSRDIADFALGSAGVPPDPETQAWVDRHYAFPVEELTFGLFLAGHRLARAVIPAKLASIRRQLLRSATAHPDLAEVYQARAAVFLAREQTFDPQASVDLAAARRREAIGLLDRLEDHLADGRAVMIPPGYTVADVVWTVFLARIELLGMAGEIARRPALAGYWSQAKARPSFKAADVWTKFHPARIAWGIVRG